MKKIILAGLLACLGTVVLQAQDEINLSDNPKTAQTYIGIKGGLNYPSVRYSNAYLNDYRTKSFSATIFGVFAELPLNEQNTLSFRPEITLMTRGQQINDKTVAYSMDAKYTDLYLPFVYTFRNEEDNAFLNPFILAGPVVGAATGGEIKLDRTKIDVSDGSLNPLHLGVYAGAGVKIPIRSNGREVLNLAVEAGYFLGLNDTYSKKEKDGDSKALNVNSYEIDGTRKHRGLQVQVSAAVPLSVFKKKEKPQPPVVDEPVEEVEIIPVAVEKPCYTLEEMREMIQNKEDIEGKKICAIEQVTFEFGASEITRYSETYLNQIVALMNENQVMKITVNGHTDNVGAEEYNMELSRKRAESVYKYLIKKGAPSNRLSFRYYGMTKPIADNETEEGRATNRRVEFEIINQ